VQARPVVRARQEHFVDPFWFELRVSATGHPVSPASHMTSLTP
jgi:hypothetical protein